MSNFLHRLFGEKVPKTLIQLALLSIVVGFLLSVIGFNPYRLWQSIQDLVSFIWHSGFDMLYALWSYLLLGAVIVIPLWLALRLFSKKA